MKRFIKNTAFFKIIKKQQLLRLANYLNRQKEYKSSSLIYSQVIKSNSSIFDKYKYAKTLNKSGEYDRCLKVLDKILSKNNHDKSAQLKAQTLISNKEPQLAEKFLKEYINNSNNSSNHAGLYYLLGTILLKQKRWWQAEESFNNAQNLGYNTANFYRKFAKSSFEMSHYENAADLYKKAIEKWDNKNEGFTVSELYYLVGLSYEMNENNKLSGNYYEKSINNNDNKNLHEMTIGIFHEKYFQYKKAENIYNRMLDEGKGVRAEILKRLSILSYIQNKYEDSIRFLNESISMDTTDYYPYEMLADIHYKMNDYKSAAGLYREAFVRCDFINTKLINKYIKSLIKINNTKESIKMLSLLNKINSVEDVSNVSYTDTSNIYTYLYENTDINENVIIYESMQGRDFTCNPYAIFKHILNEPEFNKYKHVIVINNKAYIDDALLSNKNIILVSKDSFLYTLYLASSKYLINNTSFPSYFIRKPDQKYLNTWHGTPWKYLGKDLHDSYKTIGNIQRNLLLSTHLISQNKHMSRIMTEKYDIADVYSGMVSETGYPRNDVTLTASDTYKKQLKKKIGIDSDKKIVFYAPTWRGNDVSSSDDETEIIYQTLEKLKNLNCEVIFRGHYFADKDQSNEIIEKYTINNKFKTNELLAIADILVTDYSSVLFDFASTKKPIIKYLYDYEKYKNQRGLYFEYSEVPGESVFEIDSLIESVNSHLNNKSNTSIHENTVLNSPDGQNSTRKTVEFFFHNKKDHVVDIGNDNKNILMYVGSFGPNGITSSAINLMNTIDKSMYNIHLLIDKKGIEHRPDNERLFDTINKDIRIISKPGKINKTSKSDEICHKSVTYDSDPIEFNHLYDREYDRIFGVDTKFDYAINYDGYTRSSIWLFACNRMKLNSKSRSIYIHSMIYDEYLNKYSYLDEVFKLYNKFDNIVSVSEPSMQKNRKDLSSKYSIDRKKFIYTDNIQDPDKIIELSKRPIKNKNELKIMNDGRITFINIGRHSIEKGQIKLVKAFNEVYKKNNNTKLVLIGDGPVNRRLKDLSKDLGLYDSVYFFGYKANPFQYLKKSDCFVLSSDYEGQGMVIYESFSLDVPVISTDNGVSHEIFKEGYGMLCDRTQEGLSKAMSEFLKQQNKFKKFDIYNYNKNALNKFYDKVVG